MKPALFFIVFSLLTVNTVFSQTDTTQEGKVLFIYEESNSSISPWTTLFKNQFSDKSIDTDMISASEIGKKNIDLSLYNIVVIHGSVMAFTMKEPVRNWLKKEPNISGKKVYLLVTAGGSHLEKYSKQLKKLLAKNDANVVDVVTSATGKLTDEEKKSLVEDFVQKIGK